MRLGQPWTREIVPGIARLGTPFVGFYVVEDAGAYILIDTGLPGYWGQLAAFLAARQAPMSAVEAVVLTHCHDDHKGNAELLRKDEGVRVLVHTDDLTATLSKGRIPKVPLWRHRVLHYGLHVLRAGAARVPPVLEASTFDDGEVLDLPGRPRVIHTPGHTPGTLLCTWPIVRSLPSAMSWRPSTSSPARPVRGYCRRSSTQITTRRLRRCRTSNARQLAGFCPATACPRSAPLRRRWRRREGPQFESHQSGATSRCGTRPGPAASRA